MKYGCIALQNILVWRIGLLTLAIVLLAACGGPDGHPIGETHWQVEFPKEYTNNLNTADTLSVNTVCGLEIPGEMIQLFEFQHSNKNDTLPVPNAITAFIAKRDFLETAKVSDCALEIEQMYAYFLGMNNVNYQAKRTDLKIDGIDFIELENDIYSANGQPTHGDLHYLAEIDGYILHVQLSYKDATEKKRLMESLKASRFVR